jgi:hypothetical protein
MSQVSASLQIQFDAKGNVLNRYMSGSMNGIDNEKDVDAQVAQSVESIKKSWTETEKAMTEQLAGKTN